MADSILEAIERHLEHGHPSTCYDSPSHLFRCVILPTFIHQVSTSWAQQSNEEIYALAFPSAACESLTISLKNWNIDACKAITVSLLRSHQARKNTMAPSDHTALLFSKSCCRDWTKWVAPTSEGQHETLATLKPGSSESSLPRQMGESRQLRQSQRWHRSLEVDKQRWTDDRDCRKFTQRFLIISSLSTINIIQKGSSSSDLPAQMSKFESPSMLSLGNHSGLSPRTSFSS